MGGEPARVVHGAAGNDETHEAQRYSTTIGLRDSPSKTPFVVGWLCSQSPGAAMPARLTWMQEVVVRALCVVVRLPCP